MQGVCCVQGHIHVRGHSRGQCHCECQGYTQGHTNLHCEIGPITYVCILSIFDPEFLYIAAWICCIGHYFSEPPSIAEYNDSNMAGIKWSAIDIWRLLLIIYMYTIIDFDLRKICLMTQNFSTCHFGNMMTSFQFNHPSISWFMAGYNVTKISKYAYDLENHIEVEYPLSVMVFEIFAINCTNPTACSRSYSCQRS